MCIDIAISVQKRAFDDGDKDDGTRLQERTDHVNNVNSVLLAEILFSSVCKCISVT